MFEVGDTIRILSNAIRCGVPDNIMGKDCVVTKINVYNTKASILRFRVLKYPCTDSAIEWNCYYTDAIRVLLKGEQLLLWGDI